MNKKAPFILIASATLLASLASCGSSGGGSESSSPSSESTSENAESSSASSSSSSSSQSSSSSSSSQSDSETSSEPSSSSEEPQHNHAYNDDHICPDDGYSEKGKLAVNLDGELNEAKWTGLSAENSLSDIASDGRGMKIKGFTSGDYAFFAFEVYSKTNAFAEAEIIFNADNATDSLALLSEGKTTWSGKFIGAVAKTQKQENGLYRSCVEIAAKRSEVLSSDGTLMASFGARVAAEQSDSSYMEDNKPEYWVLNGLNPWGGKGSAFNVDDNGIHHIHSYDGGSCIWCGASAPSAQMAITPDGDLSDWDAAIMKKYIGSSDEEDRHFGWNAFTDDTYLYLTAKLTHKSAGVDELNLASTTINTLETTVAKRSGSGYAFSGPGLVKGGYKETLDEATGLTTTVFEMVFVKDPWASPTGVNLGVLAWLPDTSDASEHFNIYDWVDGAKEVRPGYWGITCEHNAWGAGGRFNVTSSGVEHAHSYQNGKCAICEKTLAINPDGDLSDWDANIKKKYIGSSDSEGRHFGWNAFVDDDYLYLTATLTHKASHVTHLRMLKNDSGEENIALNSGDSYTFAGTGLISGGFDEKEDSSTGLTTTVFELVFDKTPWSTDGVVSIGLLARLDAATDDSSHFNIYKYEDGNKIVSPGYWGITCDHNAWGAGGRFEVASSGVQHVHSYNNGYCVLCNEADTTYGIVLDGNLSDWSDEILATKASDSDSAGPSLSFVGFADDEYVYVAMTATHKDLVYFSLTTKDNDEIWLSSKAGTGEVAIEKGGSYVEAFGCKSVDGENGYIATTVEAVLPLSALGKAELGYAVQAMTDGENSETLHLKSHGWTYHYWVIKQLDNCKYHFTFDETGMLHEHAYKSGKCVICDADFQVGAIRIDGDISDFSEAAKNTKITTTASNGESISLSGFADDTYVYLGVNVKTTSANVSSIELLGKTYDVSSEPWVNAYSLSVNDGEVSATSRDVKCASARTYDQSGNHYNYTFEIAVLKSGFPAETDGSVKVGICVNGCSENSELSCNPTNASQLGYWGVAGYNGWWFEPHCFVFSASGVSKPSSGTAGE